MAGNLSQKRAAKRYGVTVDNLDEFSKTIIKQFI